jgi:hypothetical protein
MLKIFDTVYDKTLFFLTEKFTQGYFYCCNMKVLHTEIGNGFLDIVSSQLI